jgi:hypothetical protein
VYLNTGEAVPYNGYYLFDENGVFLDDRSRIVNDYYFDHGIAWDGTWRVVELDGYYYLINGGTLKISKNLSAYIQSHQTGGLVTANVTYHFGADGRMTDQLVKIDKDSVRVDAVTVMGRAVNVKNGQACRAGYLVDGKYVTAEVIRQDDGSYTFVIPSEVAEKTEILIVLAGDVSGDGKVDANDQQRLAAALLPSDYAGAVELTPEQLLAADINGNGEFNSADRALIARSLLDKNHKLYQAISW